MRVYRNDNYDVRGSFWHPPADPDTRRRPPLPNPDPDPQPDARAESEAFGYFASTTNGGNFTGGIIPFTFADPINRNVDLLIPNMQVKPRVTGIYRIVYSVTATAASAFFLQLTLNSIPVASSIIPILTGVNTNEIFLFQSSNDILTLNLTGAVALAAGKNASLLLQLIEI